MSLNRARLDNKQLAGVATHHTGGTTATPIKFTVDTKHKACIQSSLSMHMTLPVTRSLDTARGSKR
jgi:hypothetical protein